MRTIVAGSRTVTNFEVVAEAIAKSGFAVTEVVSGCARGVDRLGELWARQHGVMIGHYPAEWERFGRSAGMRRNADMAHYADALIAIWDGQSRGTKHMIDTMRKLNKPVFVWEVQA